MSGTAELFFLVENKSIDSEVATGIIYHFKDRTNLKEKVIEFVMAHYPHRAGQEAAVARTYAKLANEGFRMRVEGSYQLLDFESWLFDYEKPVGPKRVV